MEVSFQNRCSKQTAYKHFPQGMWSWSLHKVHVRYITKRLFDPIHGVNQKHRKKLRPIFFNAVWLQKMDWEDAKQKKHNPNVYVMQKGIIPFPRDHANARVHPFDAFRNLISLLILRTWEFDPGENRWFLLYLNGRWKERVQGADICLCE